MAAVSRSYVTFEGGKYKVRDSGLDEVIFTTVKVGGSGGKILSIVSGKWDFNGAALSNIAAGSLAGEAVEYAQLNTALALKQSLSERGQNNGYASLDSGGKVPVAQLPNSILEYIGVWDASTNTPALADYASGAAAGTHIGDVYKVSVAGTQNLGSGSIAFAVGDYAIINNLGKFEKAHAGADAVVSVNGLAGIVVLTTNDVAESVNLYYTQARFDAAFAAKSTTSLAEGTNLYFTTARAKSAAVADVIVDGVTDVAPSQNAVFDALALKADLSTVSTSQAFTNDNAGAITARQLVYVKANGAVDKVTAALATFGSVVLVVKDASIAAAGSGQCYTRGDTISGFTGLTPGKPVYVHQSTAGLYEQDPTTVTTGNLYQIGYAVSATQVVYSPRHIIEL